MSLPVTGHAGAGSCDPLALEQSDPHSNVTVVDVACSGGEILEQEKNPAFSATGGLLSPQKKIKQPSQQSNTGPGDYMPRRSTS